MISEEEKIKTLGADVDNLTPSFDEDELKKLGHKCFDLYEQDQESRNTWLSTHEEYLEIYHQLDNYDSNFGGGFKGSDARIPLLTESCLGFQARAYKALFPQRSFVATVSMEDITEDEINRAERVAKWMNYLLNFRYRRYRRDKKRMLLASALMGSDFSKTYKCPLTGLPKVERVRAQDFVVNYAMGAVELEDIRRKTQIIYLDINEARMYYRNGFFSSMPETTRTLDNEGNSLQEVINEAQGRQETNENDSQITILEQHTYYDLDGDGIEEPIIIWLCANSKKVLRLSARFDINDPNKTAIEYFTHYSFIDNTDGFYGYGYGHLIARLNQALNRQLRNSLDAGELANVGNMSGFISEGAGVKGGEVELELGKMKKIPRTMEDISKAIYQMRFPGPNPSYVGLIEFMQGIIQRLANTTEAVSGDVSKVYQPMTILTMLEQSLQLPTSIMETLAGSMESELDKIFKIAAKDAPTLDTFNYEDERISVTAEDFRRATRVYPIMDPRNITKQQKMAKAQAVYQLAANNPLIAQQPSSMYNVTKQVLESMEVQDIDEILPKPQNQEPERIDDQHAENMYFLLPPQDRPFFDVFPDQDHETHIAIIDKLLSEDAMQQQQTGQSQIPEESMQAILIHRQKHVAYLYGQMHGVINGSRQLGAMEEAPGDEALLAALAAEFSMGAESENMPIGESGEVPGAGTGIGGDAELSGEGILGRVPLDER